MTVSKKTRAALRERANECCEACGRPGATNAHHRVNQSQGGPDTLSNLMLVCGSGTTGCHGWITEHPTDAGVLGYAVSLARLGEISRDKDISPAHIPVWRFSREIGKNEWALLDDEGTLTPAFEDL